MTPEQQRIAIAEACGFDVKICQSHRSTVCCGRPMIPDYLNDLNAMHEAEKLLTREQCHLYNTALVDTLFARPDDPVQSSRWTWGATASQRAEAFLRTIGKWEGHP